MDESIRRPDAAWRPRCCGMRRYADATAIALDPRAIWRHWADHVEGQGIVSGHLMAEEAPDAVLAAVLPFLEQHHPNRRLP